MRKDQQEINNKFEELNNKFGKLQKTYDERNSSFYKTIKVH